MKEVTAVPGATDLKGDKVSEATREKLFKDAMFISFLLTTSVFASELLVGIVSSSLAIISDALHASIDFTTTLLLFVAGRIAIKPPDKNHTYGHGKVDIIGGFLGAIVLLFMAVYILYEVVVRWLVGKYNPNIGPLSYAVLCYVLLTEVLKARILSRNRDKEVIKVGFTHNLADAGSTMIAIFSSLAVNLGFPQADLLASAALSGIITFASVKMLRSLVLELSDAISEKDILEAKALLMRIKDHDGFKDLRMRRVGSIYYVEVTIIMKSNASVEEAHGVSEKIEEAFKNKFGPESVCTIHIEPSSEENVIRKSISEEVKDIRGLKNIHSVKLGLVSGIVHIALHASVEGDITLKEAHEIADEIERKLYRKFKNTRTVVHLEPYEDESASVEKARFDLAAIQESIRNTVGVKEVSVIEVYELEGKKCCEICIKADRNMPLEDAHKIASDVEELVKSKLKIDIPVEVHVEPV